MFSNAFGVDTGTEELIEQWITKAKQNDIAQLRRSLRYPLFRAARIVQGSLEIAAHCRDVSPRGIGLLHSQPVEKGKATVELCLPERDVKLALDVRWINQFADGWWISGGRFKTSSIYYAYLLMSTIKGAMERRQHKRYPFFRQFTLHASDSDEELTEHSVCCLDISLGGMSVLSDAYIEVDELRLRTGHADGFVDLRGYVVSFREFSNGLAIYGIAFKPLKKPQQFELDNQQTNPVPAALRA